MKQKTYRNILLESDIKFSEFDIIKHLYHQQYLFVLDSELGNRKEYLFFCKLDKKTFLVTDPYHSCRSCECYSFDDMIKRLMTLEEFEKWCKTIKSRAALERY